MSLKVPPEKHFFSHRTPRPPPLLLIFRHGIHEPHKRGLFHPATTTPATPVNPTALSTHGHRHIMASRQGLFLRPSHPHTREPAQPPPISSTPAPALSLRLANSLACCALLVPSLVSFQCWCKPIEVGHHRHRRRLGGLSVCLVYNTFSWCSNISCAGAGSKASLVTAASWAAEPPPPLAYTPLRF